MIESLFRGVNPPHVAELVHSPLPTAVSVLPLGVCALTTEEIKRKNTESLKIFFMPESFRVLFFVLLRVRVHGLFRHNTILADTGGAGDRHGIRPNARGGFSVY